MERHRCAIPIGARKGIPSTGITDALQAVARKDAHLDRSRRE